jgi:3-oxoacyl-[acyl-carrier-protein] synthase-3
MKKGLLLVGDTPSKFKSRNDKTAWPLFGDAGTVTALEFDMKANDMCFTFATEGSEVIILRDGGARNPVTTASLEEVSYGEGIARRPLDSEMDGMAVFAFGIKRVPESVLDLLDYIKMDKEDIDLFIFHQANHFMNEKIRKKLNIPEEKVPYSLQNYGNTSCATVPLTLVSQCNEELNTTKKQIIATAFGVGLSWGSVYFSIDTIKCLPVITYY